MHRSIEINAFEHLSASMSASYMRICKAYSYSTEQLSGGVDTVTNKYPIEGK